MAAAAVEILQCSVFISMGQSPDKCAFFAESSLPDLEPGQQFFFALELSSD